MAREYRVTAMTRLASWMVAGMTRMGIGRSVVLTTVGRRSGEARRVPLSPVSSGGIDYLVAPYGEVGWVRNARANPEVEIRRGRSVRHVSLTEVTGEVPELVKAYYDREPFPRAFMDVPGEATVDDFASVGDRFPVFRIEGLARTGSL